MSEDAKPIAFPHYSRPANPKGILPANLAQSKLLFKAIKTFAKLSKPRARSRRGLTAPDIVVIKKRKTTRFY